MSSLVSVIIVTYNSSQFVVETLESISNQSWNEIELIITDDCSQDGTVEICVNWINKNSQRFVSSEVITFEKNTGVPANVNRGLYKAKGDWIKLLGADDTLKPNCIEDNMSMIATHPEIKALFSCVEVYKNIFRSKNFLTTIPNDPFNSEGIMAPDRSVESQYKMLLLSDRIHYTPSAFLHRETLLTIGSFDERFRLLEDYPLWLKLTKSGQRLYFMNKSTVNYRQHEAAINNVLTDNLIKPNYFRTENFRRIYTYPNLPKDIRLSQVFTWYGSQIFRCNLINKNKKLTRFLLSLLTVYLNPFKYYIYLKKCLIKNLKFNEFYK
jgi:glycosyltransferase involved in cell wall biosynthesis